MRIRASTLLETVVSMGIMGFVLASSGIIYANVLRSDRSLHRTKARLMIDAAAAGRPLPRSDLNLGTEVRQLGHGAQSVRYTVTDATGTIILEHERISPAPWNE